MASVISAVNPAKNLNSSLEFILATVLLMFPTNVEIVDPTPANIFNDPITAEVTSVSLQSILTLYLHF